MTLTARATKSVRIRDVAGQRSGAIGFQNLVFAHQAQGVESVIDLTAMVVPTGWGAQGFLQPTLNQLLAAQIKQYHTNLNIKSSVHGPLTEFDDYNVTSNSLITLKGFTLQAGEIITCTTNFAPQPGLIAVDNVARPKCYTLLAGQTTIPVGWPFEVNKFPSEQIGAVMITMDGIVQMRCVGNQLTGAGNYIEVQALSTGLGNQIQMKDAPFDDDRQIMVIPLMAAAVAPSASILSYLDSLNGVVNQIAQDLAAVTENDISRYQVAPSGTDLASFGAKVTQLSAWVTKNADYTAASGDQILADTSSGPMTITLPANGQVNVADAKRTWQNNAVTIASALIEGVTQTMTLDQEGGELAFRWVDNTYGWSVFKQSPEGV